MRMKKWLVIMAGVAVALPLTACGGKTVATTSGGKVTESAYYSSMKNTSSGKQILQQMILNKVLEKDYGSKVSTAQVNKQYTNYKSQYGNDFSSVLAQNGMTTTSLREQVRSNLLLKEAVRDNTKITQKDLDKQWKSYEPKVQVQQILVGSEDDAKSIISTMQGTDQKDQKAEFTKLAKEKSTDTATKSNGGKIPAFDNSDTSLNGDFKKAAFKLKTGEFTTDPVKTDSGYQVIYMVDHPSKGSEKNHTADLKSQIIDSKMNDTTALHDIVAKVLKNGNVQIKDNDLKDVLNGYISNSTSSMKK